MEQCNPAIKHSVPQASLVITSDYRLWGVGPQNYRFRTMFFGMKDVTFLGAVGRKRLVQEQEMAEITAYPCRYEELFCYAIAESQYASNLTITSNVGALDTTNMGIKVNGNPEDLMWRKKFIETVIEFLLDRNLLEKWRRELAVKAADRFGIDSVSAQWNSLIFD